MTYDYLVVGAGLSGAVVAERLAAGADRSVLVVEARPHVAGNCYDEYDEAGVLVHRYGPHWFHTGSARVLTYLSRFTGWRRHEHLVRASVGEQLVPMPVNRSTLRLLCGVPLASDAEALALLDRLREPIAAPANAEEAVVARVGRVLYEQLFAGYTRKQWGREPSSLAASVTARIPVRTNEDMRYFTDPFQGVPDRGYTEMVRRILDHPRIEVVLGTDYRDVIGSTRFSRIVYTGPLDSFFDHAYGRLPYRSLRFTSRTLDQEWFQPVQQVNYPDDRPYTRTVEWKHATGQRLPRTTVTWEYPCAPTSDVDKYYPVPCPDSDEMAARYRAASAALASVTFLGRLADYRYYNMDQAVSRALGVARTLTRDRCRPPSGPDVLRPHADADEVRRDGLQQRDPVEQLQRPRRAAALAAALAGDEPGQEPVLQEALAALGQHGGPGAPALHGRQVRLGEGPGPQWTGEPLGGRDRVLHGEVDPDPADRRHRVRGVAEAQEAVPVPAGEPVHLHVQHADVGPVAELVDPVGQDRLQPREVGAEVG
jgi:UDP-galactopyranose mutase